MKKYMKPVSTVFDVNIDNHILAAVSSVNADGTEDVTIPLIMEYYELLEDEEEEEARRLKRRRVNKE